ncbi:MAG: hypothetical protein ACRBBR_07870 [Cellvibrionaceae bacterium]
MYSRQHGLAKLTTLVVIAAILGVLAAAVMLMPKGFKDDLSVIGQGSVVVVLVHDKHLVGGTKMMELLNKIRPDYEGKVEFLAVDVATPIGQSFVRQQQVDVIDLVVFGVDGSRQELIKAGVSEQQLRSVLDNAVR